MLQRLFDVALHNAESNSEFLCFAQDSSEELPSHLLRDDFTQCETHLHTYLLHYITHQRILRAICCKLKVNFTYLVIRFASRGLDRQWDIFLAPIEAYCNPHDCDTRVS